MLTMRIVWKNGAVDFIEVPQFVGPTLSTMHCKGLEKASSSIDYVAFVRTGFKRDGYGNFVISRDVRWMPSKQTVENDGNIEDTIVLSAAELPYVSEVYVDDMVVYSSDKAV